MTKITQSWQTKIVTELLMSACGDLTLNRRGDLARKETCDEEWNDLPAGQYRYGDVLAQITREGWKLTADGAQFILENCCPHQGYDLRCLRHVAQAA